MARHVLPRVHPKVDNDGGGEQHAYLRVLCHLSADQSTDVHVSSTHAIINMINMLRFTAGLSKCYHAQIITPAGLRASYSTVTETQSSLLNSLILTIVDFAADMARPLPLQLLR